MLVLLLALPLAAGAVLGTEQLVELKVSGISEDLVRLIVESGYSDLERVIRLKKAGFQDETIASIIKRDLKESQPAVAAAPSSQPGAAPETVESKSNTRVRIEWYMVYRGSPLLQNTDEFNNATVSLLAGKTLKVEWPDKDGLGMLDVLTQKPFKSPLYWNIDKDDILHPGQQGYAYVLQSGKSHGGKPDVDESHYWVLYLQPSDPQDRIGQVLRSSALAGETQQGKN